MDAQRGGVGCGGVDVSGGGNGKDAAKQDNTDTRVAIEVLV